MSGMRARAGSGMPNHTGSGTQAPTGIGMLSALGSARRPASGREPWFVPEITERPTADLGAADAPAPLRSIGLAAVADPPAETR